jgi:hypothetical protein
MLTLTSVSRAVGTALTCVQARTIIWTVYALAGLFAGIAGLRISSNVMAADANNAGLFIELDAILAVVIGGTSLAGGKFSLAGTLVGVLVIQTLTLTVTILGVPPAVTPLFKAVVVIAVCIMQSPVVRARIASRRRVPVIELELVVVRLHARLPAGRDVRRPLGAAHGGSRRLPHLLDVHGRLRGARRGDEPFHGGFGVLTLQGVTKPTFHGFRRLHVLGDGLVAEIPAGVVTRRSTDGRVAGLFFHYPPEEPQTVPASFGARDDADADGVLEVRTTLRPWAVASLVEALAPGSR